MRKYDDNRIVALKFDRSQGFTVTQLIAKYSMPKTSVWHHIKDINLSDDVRRIITSSRGGSTMRAKNRWSRQEEIAKGIFENFDENTAWPVLLTALYWAEGTKSSFVFTNTDADMIRIFLKTIRTHLKIADTDVDVLIRVHHQSKISECRHYWSKVTGIAVRSIRTNVHDKYNKSVATYGMCRLTLRKGGNHLKLMHCLIRVLTARMLTPAKLP